MKAQIGFRQTPWTVYGIVHAASTKINHNAADILGAFASNLL